MSREAMQIALDALEANLGNWAAKTKAVEVLRQALKTEQEPFEYWNAVEGWVKIDEVREHFNAVGCGTIYKSAGEGRTPLYTAQPKHDYVIDCPRCGHCCAEREWVGLTDEEVCNAIDDVLEGGGWLDVARAIEQALKEKNT